MTVETIRTRQEERCFLCGGRGAALYRNLTDRLFGSPGKWGFNRCREEECGLVWLDPQPLREDIGKLYSSYYTHQVPWFPNKHRIADFLQLNFLRACQTILQFTPVIRERKKLLHMYLSGLPPGLLVDLGCGDGSFLLRMRRLGWRVTGQEIDPSAAVFRRNDEDLPVYLGPVEDLSLPEATFDAVTMNHVIEHVPDPVTVLKECHRILKPGGVLVAVTPNVQSHGHGQFGPSWRGLEPPRHLFLYSLRTLEAIGARAGLRERSVFSTAANAEAILTASGDIRSTGTHDMTALPSLKKAILGVRAQLKAQRIHRDRPDSGEECVMIARK